MSTCQQFDEAYQKQLVTYRRLKPEIDRIYAHGSFIAIADDEVIASGPTLRDMREIVRSKGLDPRNLFVVQAGVEYPDYVTIFM